MIRIFKRRKITNTVVLTVWQRLADAINGKARRLAYYLNNKATTVNRRKVKAFLIVFCIVSAIGSAYIIIRALQKKRTAYTVTAIVVPKHIEQNNPAFEDTAIANAVIRIEHFKYWLDSLHQRGSPLYDSIIQARPGLIDSIHFIEQYYSSKK